MNDQEKFERRGPPPGWAAPVIVLLGVLLVGSGWQLYISHAEVSRTSRLLQQTQTLGSTLREIHMRYLQSVSSLRLYVANHNSLQSSDYEEGIRSLTTLLEQGAVEAAREPDVPQREAIDGLIVLLAGRIEQMRLARAGFDAEGLPKLVEITRSLDTDETDRRAKERIASVLARKDALVAERESAVQRIDERFQWVLLGFLAVVMMLIALLFQRGQRERMRRRQADEALRATARALESRSAELENANRDLESFSFTVSHDLRSPLRIIEGYAGMLEDDQGERLTEDVRLTVRKIREGASRMSALIADLLAFSRLGKESLVVTLVATKEMVGDVWEETLASWPRSNAVLQLGPLPEAPGDARLIRQVWANLLDNAVKYSSEVGEPKVEVSGSCDAGFARYVVRDNGIGFDMRTAERLFGVFQRLHNDPRFSGTGAGLAIVRRIVERHGGEVWVTAAVGEGASFGFSLPLDVGAGDPR
jgi:signal transduction histidine kinase